MIHPFSLKHAYASKYYDPLKAHEYYMRTRELKGRRSTTQLNAEGKQVWRDTKANIQEEKKTVMSQARVEHNARMDALRQEASETRSRISEKLKEALARISERNASRLELETQQTKAELEREKNNTQASIDRLMAEDYANLSSDQREQKLTDRAEKVAKLRSDLSSYTAQIREDVKKDKADIRSNTAQDKESERSSAKSEREALSEDLKTQLDLARAAYDSLKQSIADGYETTFDQEFEAIKTLYAASSKKPSGKTKSVASSSDRSPTPTIVKRSAEERAKIRRELYEERQRKTKSK